MPKSIKRNVVGKLSDAQVAALTNLYNGRPSSDGLRGMSAHGGHESTLLSLCRRGLVEFTKTSGYALTEYGCETIEKLLKKNGGSK